MQSQDEVGTVNMIDVEIEITPAEARVLAKRAYLYGFPMVMNYKTMWNYAVDKDNPDYKGPFNELANIARVFTPDDKTIVTPNADTPYSFAWLDLRAEPMVLTVPEIEPNRFYHFQLIDLYTHNFAYIGTLTTGNGAGKFLIAGPDWDGEKPDGITDVIRSETPIVFNGTRTQLFNPEDIDKVKEIQAHYGLQSLSAFRGTEVPDAPTQLEFPKWEEGAQFDERFFAYLDFIMGLLGEPGDGEQELWNELGNLGIGTEDSFDISALPVEIQEALTAGVKEGFDEIEAFIAEYAKDPLASGKLFGTREFLTKSAKENYQLDLPDLLRSVAAHQGLYGNSASEAIYPTYFTDVDKEPLDASKQSYTLTFQQDALPPVKSFWSLTMYDAKTQLFIDNPLNRYLLNSTTMDQFARGEDGSLVFYISKESPGKDLEANWLPAPDGPFYLTMRLYGPEPEALSGEWTPPALAKATAPAADAVKADTPPGDNEIENLVRRTYQYVAMYNVINKGAMMEGNPQRTGWNGTYVPTALNDHNNKAIARPNNDTLYVPTLMDLRNDAVVVSYPAFDSKFVCLETSAYDHYCGIPLSTTKGDFKKPIKLLYYSKRTEGYGGEPVEGVDQVIEMSGDFVAAFLRVMPHGAEPERFKKILREMKEVKAVTLTEYLGKPAQPTDDPQFPDYGATDADIYSNNFAEVMQFVVNHSTFDTDDKMDAAVLAALKPLGIEPGKQYDSKTAAKVDGKAMAEVVGRIHQEAVEIWTGPEAASFVDSTFKPKGEMILEAMLVQSAYGPIGLPSHQAVYPAIVSTDGKPLNAQNDYVIRMTKDQMPPAKAFWSVTLYDLKNGFFIPNERKKYSVGENAGMKLNEEGGIEIHVAAEQPVGVPEENWLPLVRGDEAVDIVMRLYAPDLEKFKTWEPPKAEMVK